jgi:hypothetical protein
MEVYGLGSTMHAASKLLVLGTITEHPRTYEIA